MAVKRYRVEVSHVEDRAWKLHHHINAGKKPERDILLDAEDLWMTEGMPTRVLNPSGIVLGTFGE